MAVVNRTGRRRIIACSGGKRRGIITDWIRKSLSDYYKVLQMLPELRVRVIAPFFAYLDPQENYFRQEGFGLIRWSSGCMNLGCSRLGSLMCCDPVRRSKVRAARCVALELSPSLPSQRTQILRTAL